MPRACVTMSNDNMSLSAVPGVGDALIECHVGEVVFKDACPDFAIVFRCYEAVVLHLEIDIVIFRRSIARKDHALYSSGIMPHMVYGDFQSVFQDFASIDFCADPETVS